MKWQITGHKTVHVTCQKWCWVFHLNLQVSSRSSLSSTLNDESDYLLDPDPVIDLFVNGDKYRKIGNPMVFKQQTSGTTS